MNSSKLGFLTNFESHPKLPIMTPIKGYSYGDPNLELSPVTLQDLDLLKKTLLWSDEDDHFLKLAGEVLKDQTDDVLDLWYGYVGGNPHLLYYFTVTDLAKFLG